MELLERYMRRPDAPTGVNGINAANAVSLPSDDAILALALKNQTFSKLWNDSANGFPSQPEAELALCGLLAFWTGKDPQRMDALFRKSGLMRPKWDERHGKDTYGALTVQKAIASCTKVFQPKQMTAFPPLRPLKQQCGDLPPFPVDCLPGTLWDYVKAVAAHSQTSEDMAAVIGLGVLAVCLQGKFLVQGTPGYDEPLSLYTVAIAAPGERKSSVMKDMTKCLYEYEQEFNVQREPEIRKSRQEREAMERQIDSVKDKLRRCEDSELEMELHQLEDDLATLPVVKPVRFFADDCSSKALTSLLANNGGVFSVISTEGGIFDIMAGRYSSKANIDVWLKGHCGDTIRVDRLGCEPEYIPHPALSAILSIQPSVLEEIMSNATMTGRGLIARFLYASPPSRIGNRVFCAPPIPPAIAENYRSMIFDLMAIPKPEEPTRLLLSDRATEIISDYFAEHEAFLAGEGQIISDWAAKYIGAILRIAGLLHVAEQGSNGEISSESMRNAIQIGSYFLAHSGYAYSMMDTDLSIKKTSLFSDASNGIASLPSNAGSSSSCAAENSSKAATASNPRWSFWRITAISARRKPNRRTAPAGSPMSCSLSTPRFIRRNAAMDKLDLRQFLHLRQTDAKNRAKLPSKASPFESEIHPSHKSGDLYSGYFAPPGACFSSRQRRKPLGKSSESTDV